MGTHNIQQIATESVTFDLASFEQAAGSDRREAAGQLVDVLAQNGFMYLRGHGVPEPLIDAVYDQSAQFFDQDDEFKNRYYIGDQRNHRGYVPVSERGDYDDEPDRRYEAFDLGPGSCAGDYDDRNPLAGPNVYPHQTGFRWAIGRYLNEMQRVSRAVATAIAVALEVPEDFFWANMTQPTSQLRLLHYFSPSASSAAPATAVTDDVGMGAHTDYEAFTILHSRNPGFQVLDADGKWFDAAPLDGAFYFNIGDLMEAWTGGLLKATPHRVIDHGVERYSLPYFCGANYDTVVSPVRAPGREHLQSDYEPFVAGRHLVSQLERDFPYLRRSAAAAHRSSWHNSNPFEARMRRLAA